jgi:hypothetical protein
MQSAVIQGNILRNGGFELSQPASKDGAAVKSLPGWTERETHLDAVATSAAIINIDDAVLQRLDKKPEQRPLNLGKNCLRLMVLPLPSRDPRKKGPTDWPQALERVSVAVDTPMVEHTPGEWVRISFWAKVPGAYSSADGALVVDSAGGEPLAVRLGNGGVEWTQYHIYRRVPEDGRIGVTFALTGLGAAFFDDVKIEPLTGLR